MFCKECGNYIIGDCDFCQHCKTKIGKGIKYCRICGKENIVRENYTECVECKSKYFNQCNKCNCYIKTNDNYCFLCIKKFDIRIKMFFDVKIYKNKAREIYKKIIRAS